MIIRHAFITITCIALAMITVSFSGKNPVHFLKSQGFVPVQPRGSESPVYISQTEVSNEQYSEFLNDLKKNGRMSEYAIAKVDTNAWSNILVAGTPYVNYYFQHESYQIYPVVNISFDAAILFCDWLTAQFKEQGYDILIRLPDSTEWKTAASGGDENQIYSWQGNDVINRKGFYMGNFKKNTAECAYVTSPVTGFKPNISGAYNMSGNVAEMLNIKGTHKGGSWNDTEEFIRINAPDPYAGITNASPYIGFRPVAEIRTK